MNHQHSFNHRIGFFDTHNHYNFCLSLGRLWATMLGKRASMYYYLLRSIYIHTVSNKEEDYIIVPQVENRTYRLSYNVLLRSAQHSKLPPSRLEPTGIIFYANVSLNHHLPSNQTRIMLRTLSNMKKLNSHSLKEFLCDEQKPNWITRKLISKISLYAANISVSLRS